MAEVGMKFTDNSAKVEAEINDAIIQFLHEAGGEISSQASRNSRVDTGQLRSSWDYQVDESNGSVTVGSPLENAIWEEFGTGEYAVNGDGRKGGWFYKDANGVGHFTQGKTPNRTLQTAFETSNPKLQKRLESILKGMK